MKRILFLATSFLGMFNANTSYAQTDADNFYISDAVNMQKVFFLKHLLSPALDMWTCTTALLLSSLTNLNHSLKRI